MTFKMHLYVDYVIVNSRILPNINHGRKGCGWLAIRTGSKYEKKTHPRKGCGWLTRRG